MSSIFFDRLVTRLDKIDQESLKTHMRSLARERSMMDTIFQALQEGILVLDGAQRLSYANRAAEKLLGFNAEKLRGKPVASHFGDAEFNLLEDINWNEERDKREWARVLNREIEVTYPERRIISFYAAPLNAPCGEEHGEAASAIILRDITSEREKEASLLEGERFNAIKMLAAGVAHEIGNPLNALDIHLQILSRELKPLPEEQRKNIMELVDVARNEVARLDSIITQFLQAIRPAKPNFEQCDIVQLLRETLTLMRVDIENRRIEVAVSGIAKTPVMRIDRAQIKQVFFNLIKNAMEAMPDGGRLEINISCGDAYLRIDFLDTGAGIAPEDLSKIFDAYHTTKPKGSGLGLMIVQRIIRDHAGQIEVSSKPHEGTRFRLLLPLAERRIRKITST